MAVKSKQRITLGSFDFIKGMAMICIVLGHTLNTYSVEHSMAMSGLTKLIVLIRAGIIPLFFLISGFGFKPKDARIMLKKTAADLIVPYLWIAAAYALIYPVTVLLTTGSLYWTIRQTLCYVVSLLLGNTAERVLFDVAMPWWLPCWYLLATFVSFNVLNQILRLKKVWHQAAAAALSVVAGYGLFCLDFHYFCIAQGLMGVGYCFIGYALKKYSLLEKLRTSVWTYLILVPVSVAEALWGYFDLCPGEFNNVLLDYIGAGGMGLLFLLVGIYLGRLEWRPLEWVKSVGIYTYWLICIHSFEENGLPWQLWHQVVENHQMMGFLIEMAARILIMAAVCAVLKKISKYRYKRKMVRNGK